MITEKVIDTLYKTYKTRPDNADELDIDLLFKYLIENHDIAIDDNAHLIINSIPAASPFHSIPLCHIHAIVEFEHRIAIVLQSSIIFLNKHDAKTHIHLRQSKPGILDRILCRLYK